MKNTKENPLDDKLTRQEDMATYLSTLPCQWDNDVSTVETVSSRTLDCGESLMLLLPPTSSLSSSPPSPSRILLDTNNNDSYSKEESNYQDNTSISSLPVKEVVTTNTTTVSALINHAITLPCHHCYVIVYKDIL
jgi:hypothetical protein